MTKVEMDEIVKEYSMRMIHSLMYSKKSDFILTGELDEEMKEDIWMSVLRSMVRSGAATHTFRAEDAMDVFTSTDRLIKNWSWLFPGAKLPSRLTVRGLLKISRDRSHFFADAWTETNEKNPLPLWRH